jgi:hypothetical protein
MASALSGATVAGALVWCLTIHSSRSRFAARLNSGVRAHFMPSDDSLIQKIENVLSKFPKVGDSYTQRKGYGHFEDQVALSALEVEVTALALHIYGADHPTVKRIRETIGGHTLSHLHSAEGMLRGTAEALKNGLLVELRTQVLLDVQSDFIDAARQASTNGSKDVAAALLCVVLEDSVKRLATKAGRDDLLGSEYSVVVVELFKAGAISKSTKGVLLAQKDLRNSALHAQWHEVSAESVTGLLYFLPGFIEQHGV